MYFHREVCRLLCSVAKSHGCEHVALCRDAHSCASSHSALALYLLPKVCLGSLHLHCLRVGANLLHNEVYLLQFQVNDVVHESLGGSHMLAEEVVVEVCVLGERIHHIGIEVYRQQSAGVVRTERYLAARVCGDGAETEVGIAVGNALAQYCVPEQHTRLRALPCVVNNLLPQLLC